MSYYTIKHIRSHYVKLEIEIWHIFDLYSEKKHLKTLSNRQIIAVFFQKFRS